MPGSFSLRHPTTSPSRHARLGLERLELRDTPATLSLEVNYNFGKSISLYGVLGDVSNPANHTVTISGKASGSTTTDSSGFYSLTLNACDLGLVTASADVGVSSSVTLVDEAPTITNFSTTMMMDRVWVFSGYVNYFRPWDQLTVNLNGQPVTISNANLSTTTQYYFEFTVTLNGESSDNGDTVATAITPWNTTSEDACAYVTQPGN